MTRFKRPNPDQWRRTDVALTQQFIGGELRLELWETDDDQQWVPVADDRHSMEHAPLTDKTFGMMMRVMRHE